MRRSVEQSSPSVQEIEQRAITPRDLVNQVLMRFRGHSGPMVEQALRRDQFVRHASQYRFMASALLNKGDIVVDAGMLAEALSCYASAVTVCRRLSGENAEAQSVGALAQALLKTGNLLEAMDRRREALEFYEEAEAVLRVQLVRTDPDMSQDL